jgi:phosphatidylethanolamine-binding protein (PEBP) family uncharacterized protein
MSFKRETAIMQTIEIIVTGVLFSLFFLFSIAGCEKDEKRSVQDTGFKLSSPAIWSDSLLPVDYTCDGVSATLPLKWSGAPASTVSFTLIMHHEASPTDIHYYWILYNIPSSVTSLVRDVSGIGTLGTNSVNDKMQYSPPCSQGPGIKEYIFTLYALSANPAITVPPDSVTRAVMLDAIKDITISSASMKVYYSRNIK